MKCATPDIEPGVTGPAGFMSCTDSDDRFQHRITTNNSVLYQTGEVELPQMEAVYIPRVNGVSEFKWRGSVTPAIPNLSGIAR
jgi:hypothetical protein